MASLSQSTECTRCSDGLGLASISVLSTHVICVANRRALDVLSHTGVGVV